MRVMCDDVITSERYGWIFGNFEIFCIKFAEIHQKV